MTFFGLAAVNDLQGRKSETSLGRCKDLIFSVFAFPVGMVRNTFIWEIKHFLAIQIILTVHYNVCSWPFV